jgi:hypothetical protein
LKFAVPGAQAEIARDRDDIRPQLGQHLLQRLDLADVGRPAEVRITQMEDLNRHESICTV